MDEEMKKTKIATFRFGLISEFVTGVKLDYGEKEKLLNEKIERSYDIPFSSRGKISRSTLEKWVVSYKKSGHRIDGLYPKERSDKGKVRALSAHIKLAVKELKKENPKLKIPAIVNLLKHKKLIEQNEHVSVTSLYRYLKHEKLNSINEDAIDKRHFEASFPNEIWQSDVMHGPMVKAYGKICKSYLIAIIDDHSRLIVHAEFYLAETLENLMIGLRDAILRRGLPQIFYIDNGSCFRAIHLEQVAAQLGIAIKHSRPYIPQGRGKIERWFKFVRENYLQTVTLIKENIESLDLLNASFVEWVDEYNNRIHSSTKQTPYERYQKDLQCVRPAPAHLINYFRKSEFRRVKKDRTVRLMGILYEVQVGLIDKKVELRFFPENLCEVEVYFQSKSYGMAAKVNANVNSYIGRNWDQKKSEKDKQDLKIENELPATIQSGELFKNQEVSL